MRAMSAARRFLSISSDRSNSESSRAVFCAARSFWVSSPRGTRLQLPSKGVPADSVIAGTFDRLRALQTKFRRRKRLVSLTETFLAFSENLLERIHTRLPAEQGCRPIEAWRGVPSNSHGG
jgi:hypothetical protein